MKIVMAIVKGNHSGNSNDDDKVVVCVKGSKVGVNRRTLERGLRTLRVGFKSLLLQLYSLFMNDEECE